jgi:hypothetical protein
MEDARPDILIQGIGEDGTIYGLTSQPPHLRQIGTYSRSHGDIGASTRGCSETSSRSLFILLGSPSAFAPSACSVRPRQASSCRLSALAAPSSPWRPAAVISPSSPVFSRSRPSATILRIGPLAALTHAVQDGDLVKLRKKSNVRHSHNN